MDGWTALLDGKRVGKYDAIQEGSGRISADGRKVAFGALQGIGGVCDSNGDQIGMEPPEGRRRGHWQAGSGHRGRCNSWGGALIVFGRNAEIERALANGQPVVAYLVFFRGVLQLSEAIPLLAVGGAWVGTGLGVLEAGAVGSAMSALSIWVAAIAFVGIGIEVILLAERGPPNRWQGLWNEFEKATDAEFNGPFTASRTADQLAALVDKLQGVMGYRELPAPRSTRQTDILCSPAP